MNFHRHKSKLLWFIVTIAVLAGAAGIFQYNITQDKRTVAECLQNENMVMIIERYDTTEIYLLSRWSTVRTRHIFLTHFLPRK